jgi:hypothetical protein
LDDGNNPSFIIRYRFKIYNLFLNGIEASFL